MTVYFGATFTTRCRWLVLASLRIVMSIGLRRLHWALAAVERANDTWHEEISLSLSRVSSLVSCRSITVVMWCIRSKCGNVHCAAKRTDGRRQSAWRPQSRATLLNTTRCKWCNTYIRVLLLWRARCACDDNWLIFIVFMQKSFKDVYRFALSIVFIAAAAEQRLNCCCYCYYYLLVALSKRNENNRKNNAAAAKK